MLCLFLCIEITPSCLYRTLTHFQCMHIYTPTHTHTDTHIPGCVLPSNLGWPFFLESYNHPLPTSLSSSFLGKPAFRLRFDTALSGTSAPLSHPRPHFPSLGQLKHFSSGYHSHLTAYIWDCGKCWDNMVLFIYACLELRIELNTPWVVNKCHKSVGRRRKGRRGGRKERTVRK